ncbi:unnamed protein product [Nezara viridula]|uniref:Uncharacterized protein n=1 Tax=Nezara viridula TaxID=85310 RepID=A0A9P0HM60_NEZVI|nr:unnamed protein product [Nezara viridula]
MSGSGIRNIPEEQMLLSDRARNGTSILAANNGKLTSRPKVQSVASCPRQEVDWPGLCHNRRPDWTRDTPGGLRSNSLSLIVEYQLDCQVCPQHLAMAGHRLRKYSD